MCMPWIFSGDFNVVLQATEKLTESGHTSSVSYALQDLFAITDLHDLQFVGQSFTGDNSHTFCKLDRVLGNRFWELEFTGTTVDFLPKSMSDHSPSVVNIFNTHLVSISRIYGLMTLHFFIWLRSVYTYLFEVVPCKTCVFLEIFES